MMKAALVLTSLSLSCALMQAADAPKAEITNSLIRVGVYLPDARTGYYRGTRFDWSGVIYRLEYNGHKYYGPWFQKTSPKVHDFVYEGPDIVAGPCSAVTGPADEFGQIGWDEAKPGGTFIKIGVGALRKPGAGAYDKFHVYEIANPGKWTVRQNRDSLEFTHELTDAASGYAYVYRKIVRLAKGAPEMTIEHSLKNSGRRAIRTDVYNHNFLVLDGAAPGPGLTVTAPFQIRTPRAPDPKLAEIKDKRIVYLKTLEDSDRVAFPIEGFGGTAKDHEFRIENSRLHAGMSILGDRPLLRAALWSIRTVMSIEPFVAVSIEPGREFTWKSTYKYWSK